MIPFKLDYVIAATLNATAPTEAGHLRELTGIKLSADEARALFPLVLEHKWFISERLGRDVGMRVAAIDFFENVRPPRAQENSFGAWMNRTLRPLTLRNNIIHMTTR